MRVLSDHRETFLGRDYLLTREVSQPTLEHLDVEVRRILAEQEALALFILTGSRPILDALAADLVTHETLRGDDLRRHLAPVSLGAPDPAGDRNGDGRAAAPAKRARRPRKPTAPAAMDVQDPLEPRPEPRTRPPAQSPVAGGSEDTAIPAEIPDEVGREDPTIAEAPAAGAGVSGTDDDEVDRDV